MINPEPIAYINVTERTLEMAMPIRWHTPTTVDVEKIPLYLEPYKREWVGLTDDEIVSIYISAKKDRLGQGYAKAIENACKRKNGYE